MKIRMIRVLGVRAKDPGILAMADEYLVRWNNRKGWDCACLTELDEFECAHIDAVRGMVDARVFEPVELKGRQS